MRIFILSIIIVLSQAAFGQGSFIGSVMVQWVKQDGQPDREMRLLGEFSFQDAKGKVWRVPRGMVVDGASIPQVFWAVIGPPFIGDYREASVVHDYYCDTKSEAWQDVHRMFYEATIVGGVAPTKARIMYAAVYSGGPRWETVSDKGDPSKVTTVTSYPKISEGDFDKVLSWIDENNPDLSSIEQRIDQFLIPSE